MSKPPWGTPGLQHVGAVSAGFPQNGLRAGLEGVFDHIHEDALSFFWSKELNNITG